MTPLLCGSFRRFLAGFSTGIRGMLLDLCRHRPCRLESQKKVYAKVWPLFAHRTKKYETNPSSFHHLMLHNSQPGYSWHCDIQATNHECVCVGVEIVRFMFNITHQGEQTYFVAT